MVITSPVAELLITEKADSDGNTTGPKSFKCVYKYLVDQASCVVECGGELLRLTALQYSEKDTRLESTLFSIESVPSQAVKLAASLSAMSTARYPTARECWIRVVATSTT